MSYPKESRICTVRADPLTLSSTVVQEEWTSFMTVAVPRGANKEGGVAGTFSQSPYL